LKYILGRFNRVVDALRKRSTLLSSMIVDVVGLGEMEKLYEVDIEFIEARETSINPWSSDKTPYLDYLIHEGFLS
jgi:hypothetical protein